MHYKFLVPTAIPYVLCTVKLIQHVLWC